VIGQGSSAGTPLDSVSVSESPLRHGAPLDLLDGIGADGLRGKRLADTFAFDAVADGGRDLIADFETGLDGIDLRGIDANGGRSGNQAFGCIWREAFSGTAGDLRFARELLQGEVDGDGLADIEARTNDIARLALGELMS
jgi:Ca2+-binding RTX toxin-like protein